MKIKKLHITNLRAYTAATFEFQPGINLLVGINGVGKTTALEALRVCLSQIQPELSVSRGRKENFELSDIKIGASTLQVSCDFEVENHDFNLLIHKQRETVKDNQHIGNVRDQATDTPDTVAFNPEIKAVFPYTEKETTQPLALFFSTRRSLMVDRNPGNSASAGGQAVAFAEALSATREFNLRLFTDWLRSQQVLGEENPTLLKSIEVIKNAVYGFLPGFSNLQILEEDGKRTLSIDKDGTTLQINQLSDGERGVLSVVIDIARRLYQANPGLEDPLTKGKAIILIDELDLHLHPKWQRSIVENLTRVFPNCQFIATTHSPQIIGEVKAESITIIDNGIHKPASSYGVDSSRVLEEILDVSPRNKEVDTLLQSLNKALDEEKLDDAKDKIQKLIVILGPNSPEVTRSTTMLSFLEDDFEDEADS